MAKRCFTPRTARQTLTVLRPAAETLCRVYGQLERARPPRVIPEQLVDRTYFALVANLHAVLREIRRRGVSVEDLRSGLLGFPARRAGRPVLLCWRVGEATLGFWHEPGSAPSLRRPVDDDGPWEEG